jgi:hypothetical protein
MDEQPLSWCSRCRKHLPLSCFPTRTNGKPQCWCRDCFRDYWKEHYDNNKPYYFVKAKKGEKRIRAIIRQAKEKPCTDCGVQHPFYVMDFDHRPGETKLFALGSVGARVRVSLQRLLAEIAKCDVVCANCHRERTYQRKKRTRLAEEIKE